MLEQFLLFLPLGIKFNEKEAIIFADNLKNIKTNKNFILWKKIG